MEGIRPTGLEPHVYRLKWWAQLWYLAWGVIAGGIGLIFIVAEAATGSGWKDFLGWRALLLWVFMPAMGYFFFALALRSRVVLEGSRISVRGAIRDKSADIHEIVGYRVEVTRNASFWRFELRNGERVSVMRSFKVDEFFHDFLSRLTRLDEENS